ncbi:MAG: redox-regulated ATPase YchF, partial [Halobacteria archaeon]|nr:redox-regulated ATPase YchF [Halobacteria archaeon]
MITVGLAGKPNAGKSTLFKAATLADAEVGNYPFTTIDANRGVAAVRTDCPCDDNDKIDGRCGNCRGGRRYVPVELIDVAGLVPDAHEGHDPVEDIDFLKNELDMWLAGVLRDSWEKLERQSKTPEFELDEALVELLSGVGAGERDVRTALRSVDPPEKIQAWSEEDIQEFAREIRRASKPIVVAANKADVAPDDNLERLLETEHSVPTSAEFELALRKGDDGGYLDYAPGDSGFEVVGEVSDEQREGIERIRSYVDENSGTGVQEVLNEAVYDLLDTVTVYPVEDETNWTDGSGDVLPDAHLLPRGSTPRDLAYAIHSDIGDAYHHAVDARKKQRVSDDTELEEGDVVKIV